MSYENPYGLSNTQYKTLRRLFAVPPCSDISWSEIMSLLEALGGVVKEYGDRVCVAISHKRAIIHRLDNQTYASRHAVERVQYLLTTVGIEQVD